MNPSGFYVDPPSDCYVDPIYLLYKKESLWTESQRVRAGILFREYPDIKKAYYLSMRLGPLLWRKWDIQQKKVRRNDEPFCSSSWTWTKDPLINSQML